MTPPMDLGAVLAYVRRAIPVMPLWHPRDGACSCPDGGCPSPGKHPRTPHGLADASADESVIAAWWRRWPYANVGIVTGTRSGLVVVDVDDGGADAIAALEARHEPLPATLANHTRPGRVHLIFRHPGILIPNSVRKLGPGLDVRGDGGYIVAPPSRHPDGHLYAWGPDLRGRLVPEPAPMPAWLVELTRRDRRREPVPATIAPRPAGTGGTPYGRKALEGEVATLRSTGEGSRNDQLNTSAFKLFRLVAGGELDDAEVVAELAAAARGIGLEDREASRTIDSARAAAFGQPRQAPERPRREPPKPASKASTNGGGTPVRVVPPENPPKEPSRLKVARVELTPLDLGALFANPPPPARFLLEPHVLERRRHWVFGAAESGKSMWAAWVACRLTRQGRRVVYVSQENPLDEEVRRLQRLGPDLARLAFYHDTGIDLARPDHRAALMKAAEGAALVVLDTLTACWSGNEDDNAAVAALDRDVLAPIVNDLGAAVIVLDHTGHPQPFVRRQGVSAGRGASTKGQKADVVLNLAARGPQEFTIGTGKMRGAGRKPPDVLVRVVDDDEDDSLDLLVDDSADPEVNRITEDMVEAVTESGGDGLTTKLLMGAVKGRNGDKYEARKRLLAEDPPRLVARREKVKTPGGSQVATVWRLASDTLLEDDE